MTNDDMTNCVYMSVCLSVCLAHGRCCVGTAQGGAAVCRGVVTWWKSTSFTLSSTVS